MRKYWRNFTAMLSASAMLATSILGGVSPVYGADDAFKVTTSKEESARELKNKEISQFAATQGMVLLQNKGDVLPVAKDQTIALFGGGAIATVKGGGGSGDVNERSHDNVYEGLKETYKIASDSLMQEIIKSYDEAKAATRASDLENNKFFKAESGMFGGLGTIMAKDYKLTDDDIANAKADTAMYVISRYSTEGADWVKGAKGYYEISDEDVENIKKIAKAYKNSVVILNVGGVINAQTLADIEDLDSIFLMSQAGMMGGHALAQVLSGEVTPSGKTVDTWAKKYDDYPSAAGFSGNDGNVNTEDYSEGIFVGYRYFDTFGIDPLYEFGYGLSYTDFQITTEGIEADEKNVKVKVNVKNTGKTYSGKEVVEVYFSAPEGSISKPYQELVGYAKTDDLAPGKSQDLDITFKTSEMSSYSEAKAAYVMEKGDYVIRVGNSSRNTCVAGVVTLAEDVITEQLSNLTFGVNNNNAIDDDMEKKAHSHISYKEEAAEIAAAKKTAVALDPKKLGEVDGNNASPYVDKKITAYVDTTTTTNAPDDGTGRQTVKKINTTGIDKLQDVYKQTTEAAREEALNKLIAKMDPVELGTIIQGIGMGGFTGAVPEDKIGDTWVNTPGAAGESTFAYYDKYGIPNTVLSDGPAGIRITQEFKRKNGNTYYQFATAFPIGTLLAQTWDTDVINEVGKAVGEEMREFGVTLWLAPGMNIHRNPLCGRNFEYYSEDPFITGSTGAAITNGVQSNPGLGVTVKHYTSNNQEDNRMEADNHVSERAMREIYLKGFEMTVKNAQPMALMTCYNKINGTYGAGNYDTIMNALRGEWGFEGMVMTDWTAREKDILSMEAGNDMIQPGGAPKDIYQHLGVIEAPTFANDGFVESYDDMSWAAFGFIQHIENWGDFVVDKTKNNKVSTDVTVKWDAVSKNQLGNNPTDDQLIAAALSNTAVNKKVAEYVSADKAVVSVKSKSADETVFTVSYKGDYKDYETANIGYSQRSVFNILKMVMGSNHYALTDSTLQSADTWVDYLVKKWDFKKSDLVEYVKVASNDPYTASENKAETPEEKKAREEAEATAKAEAGTPAGTVSGQEVGEGVTATYQTKVPFFGKSFKKGDVAKVLGDVKVSYNGVEYKVEGAKIVKKAGGKVSENNASIVITKLSGGSDKKALKAAQKAAKKATKASKKALGKMPIMMVPMDLEAALKAGQISEAKLSGKSGKYKLEFMLNGKKFKTAKKDSFGNTFTISYDATKKEVKVEGSTDLKGSLSGNNINVDKVK